MAARPAASPLDGLETAIDGHISDIRAGAYAVDSAEVSLSSSDGVVRIAKVTALRAGNTLDASGTCWLPADTASWAAAPANLRFELHAPSIAAFNAEPNLKGPDGNVEASGTLTNGPGGCDGGITADVSALRMQDFAADGFKLHVSIQKSVATIDTLTFSLNPTDGFSATGHVAMRSPYPYDGAVTGANPRPVEIQRPASRA